MNCHSVSENNKKERASKEKFEETILDSGSWIPKEVRKEGRRRNDGIAE
jgi:hypothetical protein